MTLTTLVCVAAAPATPAASARPLIVGGTAAPSGAWPSIASLVGSYQGPDGSEQGFACTGSVVAPQWVLTAAHCTRGPQGQTPDAIGVTVGVTDRDDGSGEPISADGFVRDSAYDPQQSRNDVALVHLARPTSAPAMALATAGESTTSPAGVANAAGWGAINPEGTQYTPVLQQGYLEIAPGGDCGALVGALFDATTQTCAGTPDTTGACFGDSGGPLVEFDAVTGRPVLWGVASYAVSQGGPPCAPTLPVVYSWVPAFTDFIATTIAGQRPVAGPSSAPLEPDQSPEPAPAARAPKPVVTLRGLRVRSPISVAAADAGKLRVSVVVPTGAKYVRARLARHGRTARLAIAPAGPAGARQTIALSGARLVPGDYALTVGAGTTSRALAARVLRATVRVR